jgi:glycosyltransferase involved in cell wall biosynthesis
VPRADLPSIEPVATSPRPFWSVMIPSYKSPDLLEKTLESVLAQDPGPDAMQIEVVDDASGMAEIAAVVAAVGEGRVDLFVQSQNVGASANFTTCVRRAQGQWVHILHSDDLVLPTFYERYGAAIDAHRDALMAAGRAIIVNSSGDRVGLTPPVQVESGTMRDAAFAIVSSNPLRFPAVVVARRAYERLGGFHPALFHASDWEAWGRVASAGKVAWVDRPLALYRTHDESDTNRLVHSSTAYLDDCLLAVDELSANFEPARREEARRAGRKLVAASALHSGWQLAGEGRTRLALRHAGRHASLDAGIISAWRSLTLAGTAVVGKVSGGGSSSVSGRRAVVAPDASGVRELPAETPPAPILRGRIDSPPNEAWLHRGRVQFAGWALVGARAPAGVDILLDDGRRVKAVIGHDRSDVRGSVGEPRAEKKCGWVADVDLSGMALGPARVQLEVRDESGEYAIVSELSVIVRGEPIVGGVELPEDGSTVDGEVLIVTGWAGRDRSCFARVEVAMDGVVLGRARCCVPPPREHDLEGIRIGGAAGFAGRFAVGTRACDGELHEIVVTAWDDDGEQAEIARRKVRFRSLVVAGEDRLLAAELQARTAHVLASVEPASALSRRNLLVFTHDLDLGGAQLYLHDLVRQMLPRLEGCTIVSPRDGELSGWLRSIGADVVISGEMLPRSVVDYEGSVRTIASVIRASGCGAVLVNSLASLVAADAAVRVGLPAIWSVHESFAISDWVSDQFVRELRPYAFERLETTLRATSRLVFVAEATRALYVAGGVETANSSVVPYGVDLEAIDRYVLDYDRREAREDEGIEEGAPVLLCSALFSERKGQALLVEAFGRVAATHPDAVLVLVGERSVSYTDAVLAAAERVGVGRVKVVPMTTDAWYWYGLSDILIGAADVESMPRSILEAMAFGMPVVATNIFGIPELVREGENGWLVEPNDLRSLTDGIDRALSATPLERARLGAAGRAAMVREGRLEVLCTEMIGLIDNVGTGLVEAR